MQAANVSVLRRVACALMACVDVACLVPYRARRPHPGRRARVLRVTASVLDDSAPDSIRTAVAEHPWRGGLEPCGDYEDLCAGVVSGTFPPQLRGTLYRNGPGRLRVGSSLYSHWFDGDGQVTSLSLDGAGCRISSKLLQTPRVVAQRGDTQGWRVRGAWTQASPWWRNLLALPTNPANTSVVRWVGKLLALCEGGPPLEVDPLTLDTVRQAVPLGSPTLLGFGAHCKLDPLDGHLYNVGTQLPTLDLRVFKLDAAGAEVASNVVSFGGNLAFVHDFAISERYVALFILPFTASPKDQALSVLGLKALGGALSWHSDRPARCVVLRKSDLQVVLDCDVPAFSSYHTANAFDDGDLLSVQVARLIGSRRDLERRFENMYGAVFGREQYNELHTYTFDLADGNFVGSEATMPPSSGALPMDFPVVHPQHLGRNARYIYSTAHSGRCGFFDAVQKCDTASGTASVRLCPPGEYPSEATFVPRPGAAEEDAGWVLYLSYIAATHTSTLSIVDAARFGDEPVCVVQLPKHVPHGFHGWWDQAAAGGAR